MKEKKKRRPRYDHFAPEVTAAHEAAHAVVGWVHGEWIRDRGITLRGPDDPHDILGQAHVNRHVTPMLIPAMWAVRVTDKGTIDRLAEEGRTVDDLIRQSRDAVRWNATMQIAVDLAGPLSEVVTAERGGRPRVANSRAFQIHAELVLARTEDFVGRETSDIPDAILLAEALHGVEPFDGGEGGARRWLADVMVPRVYAVLRDSVAWAAIGRVAHALLERRTVSSEEFDALVSEAPPQQQVAPWLR